MQFPDNLEPFRLLGKHYFPNNIVDAIFSGPTYQIELQDIRSGRPVWVFLQLENDKVKDIFCDCEESSQQGGCEHMAACCQFVFSKGKKPLHLLYEESFWYSLFLELLRKSGRKKRSYQESEEGDFEIKCGDDIKLHFWAEGKARDKLREVLKEKEAETEENSIKFSSLTEDEIQMWKEGRAPENFRFELSFLGDLAKFLFLQESLNIAYEVRFDEIPNSLPNLARIYFPHLECDVPIEKDSWKELIDRMHHITTNLPFFEKFEANIKSMDFDEKDGALSVSYAFSKDILKKEGIIKLDAAVYLPGTGFFRLQDQHEKDFKFKGESLSQFLQNSIDIVRKNLPQYTYHEEVCDFSYTLFFDEKSNLNIETYLFEPHDLLKQGTHLFKEWVFMKNKGFLKIAPFKFGAPQVKISPEEVSSFITQNKTFLSQYPGYVVHAGKKEEEFAYEVDEDGGLTFQATKKKETLSKKYVKFDDWYYVANKGFFPKGRETEGISLPLDKLIPSYLVHDFIRQHHRELLNVGGFFNRECPVKSIGLSIQLKRRGLIEIIPQYEWVDEEDKKQARFYDEYVYVPKKGYYRLSPTLRPLHYIKEIQASDSAVWNSFFLEILPKLKNDYVCTVDPRLELIELLDLVVVPIEGANKDDEISKEWDVDLYFSTKKERIGVSDLLKAQKKGERFFPTQSGVIDLSSERLFWLSKLTKNRKRGAKAPFRFQAGDFLQLQAFEKISVDSSELLEEGVTLRTLLDCVPPEPPEYKTLNCDLRTYQKHGVEWLWFLYRNNLAGLLCDDMGVGKTHQVMGLISSIINWKKDKKPVFLIICPTSLMYHWQDKIKKFLPDLKLKAYTGSQRSIEDFPGSYDVLLTTYGIWRAESRMLKRFRFEAAFFDELQIAKNHVSQIYKALLDVNARMRLGVTGTPIENQLRELKSLFDIVLPGYMFSDEDYREFFVRPIEKESSIDKKRLLSQYVKPFVLRRRKQDVLPDLPEKTEEIAFAELMGEQKNLYKLVAQQQATSIIQQLRDESSPIPYMHIFQLLAHLKQICNHPATYLKDVENYERYESGKWEAFVELLEEAHESEQKVVVFSQYLAMLDLMELYLQKHKIGYAQIRGRTVDRGGEIEQFHNDPECKVFLGSLRAAGLGIDLTPASIVIHYDRWWNAARENQATDRVHRIGQKRGVQVFKLLTKETIEEKIDKMITMKSDLLDNVVAFDDHQAIKKFSRQDILYLLEGLT